MKKWLCQAVLSICAIFSRWKETSMKNVALVVDGGGIQSNNF